MTQVSYVQKLSGALWVGAVFGPMTPVFQVPQAVSKGSTHFGCVRMTPRKTIQLLGSFVLDFFRVIPCLMTYVSQQGIHDVFWGPVVPSQGYDFLLFSDRRPGEPLSCKFGLSSDPGCREGTCKKRHNMVNWEQGPSGTST